MRNVNMTIGGGIECYVTVLAGTGGDVGRNLNRWRQQMGSKPLSNDDIVKLPHLEMLGTKAPLLVVDGAYRGMRGETIKDARMLAIVCTLDGATVFVKMLGPRKAVAQQEAAFRSFCLSMK